MKYNVQNDFIFKNSKNYIILLIFVFIETKFDIFTTCIYILNSKQIWWDMIDGKKKSPNENNTTYRYSKILIASQKKYKI